MSMFYLELVLKNHILLLIYNDGVTSYNIGDGFVHFSIATQDVYKLVEHIRAKDGNITREPGPVEHGTTVTAFVKDHDGYTFALIQRSSITGPFAQVALHVGDLDRAIKLYENNLGSKVVRKDNRPDKKRKFNSQIV
ncbi:hypothetical protein TanjilG_07370 [Lupinus angustifolius]|uniref:VOC domain-containing protein n=1 Tax=Lupinus angustifolius TaxID=3871 RepID=A0A4P1R056_LUPAN|nr:hypothetical protein TanjilG_07370 [Lupinus angustifolius]